MAIQTITIIIAGNYRACSYFNSEKGEWDKNSMELTNKKEK